MVGDDNGPTPEQDTDTWRQTWPPPGYWIRVGLALIGSVVTLFLLWVLRSVLLLVVASFVLAIGFQPAITWFENRGVRRGLGLSLVLVGFLLVFGGLVAVSLPLILSQVSEFLDRLPGLVDQVASGDGLLARLAGMIDVERLTAEESSDPGPMLGLVGSVTGAAFNFLTVLVVTPYFAMSMPAIKRWLMRLMRPRHREDFVHLMGESTDLMANFIVGNLIVSVAAGVVTWVGLSIIGVPYALALAAWVAVTDLIPIFGALLGAIAVGAVAAFQGTEVLLWSVALIVVYQQVENFLIAPRVMNRAVDLSPATVIIALMVGGSLAGLFGALLALPVAALIKIVTNDYVVQERIDRVRSEVTEDGNRGRRPRNRGRVRPLP